MKKGNTALPVALVVMFVPCLIEASQHQVAYQPTRDTRTFIRLIDESEIVKGELALNAQIAMNASGLINPQVIQSFSEHVAFLSTNID